MQKEEKQVESTVEALIVKVQDLKNSLASFLARLEHEYETINWPSILDNYALLSGQLNSLGRLLKNEKVPLLRNHILLPLHLSPDPDPDLEKLTERRVCAFNHEVVPDYLRTKPEQQVEEKVNAHVAKALNTSHEAAQKQLTVMNKVTSNILDIIDSHQSEFEKDANQKASMGQTSSVSDTNSLISVTMFGKGLKSLRRPESGAGQIPQQSQVPQPKQQQMGNPGKIPSTIKTNIKSASNVHPYQRN